MTTLQIAGASVTATAAELNILDGVTSTAAELNILDGVTSTAELNILDGVTSTTTELNILNGVTATATELNILDGVTATATELNVMDGSTSTTSITLVDADRVVVNDNGTMKQVGLSDLKTYVGGTISTSGYSTGFGSSSSKYKVYVDTIGPEIITNICIDLNGLYYSGTPYTIIGKQTFTNNEYAWMYEVDNNINGYIYKVEMNCIEDLSGSTVRLRLYANTMNYNPSSSIYDQALISAYYDIKKGLNLTSSMNIAIGSTLYPGLQNTFGTDKVKLYLTGNDTTYMSTTFSTGIIIIKLYGSKIFT